MQITGADGRKVEITVKCRIDTAIEVDYYRHGGILPFVLRELINTAGPASATFSSWIGSSGIRSSLATPPMGRSVMSRVAMKQPWMAPASS